MTFANLLTFSRLIIALGAFGLMLSDWWLSASIAILVAVLLDVADGIIARKLNQVTTGGVYFDVLADKIVIISTFMVLGYKVSVTFLVLGILMLLREYTIDTMRTVAALKRIIIPADKFSKIKGALFMISMLFASFNQIWLIPEVTQVAVALGILGMVFAYTTLVRFFFKYMSRLVAND